jgi:hypothetical protein
VDRRGKKLEKKRKRRDHKKKVTAIAEQTLNSPALLARAAAREPFGPCYISAGWDDLVEPALVTVLMTRKLPRGQFAAGIALVDRTCLGIKNGFLSLQPSARALADFVKEIGEAHGGMIPCELLVAQSIVYHAIDYARSLTFEPHPDFPSPLFGPRPPVLLDTPWRNVERPIFVPGPHDNALTVVNRLERAVGAGGFELLDPYDEEEEEEDDISGARGDLVYSPLGRTISSGDSRLDIVIFRGASEKKWTLEIEDHRGRSTVWDEGFESDQAALDEALDAIEEEGGAASFAAAPST